MIVLDDVAGALRVQAEELNATLDLLKATGYRYMITDSFLEPGATVVIYYHRIPPRRSWWSRLWSRIHR